MKKRERYVVVTWPESQVLMEDKEFNKCFLINGEKGQKMFGSSAYFVPEDIIFRLIENKLL